MPRYHTISKGKECQYKFQKGILVVKRCRTIKGKKEVPLKQILNEMKIRNY